MITSRKWDLLFSTVSWIIVVALVFSVVNVWMVEPSGAGPVASAAGILGAQIFYSSLYSLEAIFLAVAKALKKNGLRKKTLLVIYLTGFFTSLLTLFIAGWTPALIDNLVISVSAAACWLYWKFKTEYITKEQFNEETNDSKIL